jgi:hypothetical protein
MCKSRTPVVPPPAPQQGKSSTVSSAAMGDLCRQREQILSALTHVVAEQLAKAPDVKEVTHECT